VPHVKAVSTMVAGGRSAQWTLHAGGPQQSQGLSSTTDACTPAVLCRAVLCCYCCQQARAFHAGLALNPADRVMQRGFW
jgi:hypothetical protein